MKRNDKYFIAATILLTGLIVGVVSQNMRTTGNVSTLAVSTMDVETIKKDLATAGIVLHEAQYWRELPAN